VKRIWDLIGKPEGKRQLGGHMCKLEVNIERDITEIWYRNVG
jgi:hypothetical protein